MIGSCSLKLTNNQVIKMSTDKLMKTKCNKQHSNQAMLSMSLSLVWIALVSQIHMTVAAGPNVNSHSVSPSEATSSSSSQPVWSYQVKPNAYVNSANGQAHAGPMSSIFDAFNGLSQRQGALSGSPFLSILPIILIAAGGMLLLLPFLTMMIASPFSGTGGLYGGGFNGGQYGYPQGLSRKRSLFSTDGLASKGFQEILDHVSTTIDELARKYTPTSGLSMATTNISNNKRSKVLHSMSELSPVNQNQGTRSQASNEKQDEANQLNTSISSGSSISNTG